MRRVAALCLPDWSIDRLRRTGAIPAPPPERGAADMSALAAAVADERANECSVPNTPGWRHGARWARGCADAVEAEIARLPAQQRPPMRDQGGRGNRHEDQQGDQPAAERQEDRGEAGVVGPAGRHHVRGE